MKATQQAGSSQSKKKTKKEAKDFKAIYEGAKHKMAKGGGCGIPAPAFRNAMVRACSMVGFKMTQAKCSIFIEPDGFDAGDGTPLVAITKGKPHYAEHYVRIQNTTDIRPRPMWDEGWEATVRVRFDADQFTVEDIANLLYRAGQQVGIGEGRPFSKDSCGMGWGDIYSRPITLRPRLVMPTLRSARVA